MKSLKRDWERRFLHPKFKDYSSVGKVAYYLSRIQYRTLLFYRLSLASHSVPIVRSIFKFFYNHYSQITGIEFFAQIGGGVILPHHGPIKVNADKVGRDLYLFHNVTIGNDYKTGRPTIGNNVFIGVNSVVLGNITIGDNVVIGACSFVNSDIPDNSLVQGNPASVIRTIESDYIQKMIGY